jgi:hypothetical protein
MTSVRHVSDGKGRCVKCGESWPCFIAVKRDELVATTRELADKGGTRTDLFRLLKERLP